MNTSLLAQTDAATAGGAAYWATLDLLTPVELEASAYWLAFSFEQQNQTYHYAPSGGRTRVKNFNAHKNGFPSNWGASNSSNTQQISIKATLSSEALAIERY